MTDFPVSRCHFLLDAPSHLTLEEARRVLESAEKHKGTRYHMDESTIEKALEVVNGIRKN